MINRPMAGYRPPETPLHTMQAEAYAQIQEQLAQQLLKEDT